MAVICGTPAPVTTRGADGAGADADLDAVRSGASQFASAVEGGDVAGQQFHLGQFRLHQLHGVEHFVE
jgi:hypothetical protein